MNPQDQTLTELRGLIGELSQQRDTILALPKRMDAVAGDITKLTGDVKTLGGALDEVQRRQMQLVRGNRKRNFRNPSDELSLRTGAMVIAMLARTGKLDALVTDGASRDRLVKEACDHLGIEKSVTALTTSEISLPYEYGREVRELIADYGVARANFARYPIGRGVARPARVSTGMEFGSITMSAEFTSKTPAFGYASLESHKVGGVVTIPRELDEQGAADIGQWLMTYGARRFAWAEDKWGFLADGTATYESVSGLSDILNDNGTASQVEAMASGETSPDDLLLSHVTGALGRLNSAAIMGAKWFFNPTMMVKLPSLNTEAHKYYKDDNILQATLFGLPIVWTHVLQAYTASAAASTNIAFVGDLSWFWFGEHGSPRIDTSFEARFYYDELAVRFIEEIDFDYNAYTAAATIKTAAS